MIGLVIAIPALLIIVLVVGAFGAKLWRDRQTLTQPLGSVVRLYGRFLILYLAAAAFAAHRGYLGGGVRGSVCVDTGDALQGGGALGPVVSARPGASLGPAGDVHACALHPSLGQWGLFLLTKLPGLVLWGCLLLLVWRLIRAAGRSGPFTRQAAAVMRQLGWVVLAGSMLCAALSHLGSDVLTTMLMTPASFGAGGIVHDVLVTGPIRALLPVPLLAGAALLAFARIIRLGAAMDDEIKATV
jgi:hypothetical protein